MIQWTAHTTPVQVREKKNYEIKVAKVRYASSTLAGKVKKLFPVGNRGALRWHFQLTGGALS